MASEQQNPNTTPNEDSSLDSILANETKNTAPQTDPTKLKSALESKDGTSKDQNPYKEQQIRPGQVVGYGVPTDQKVVIPIAKASHGPSKKLIRRLLIILGILILTLLLASFGFIAKKVATPS